MSRSSTFPMLLSRKFSRGANARGKTGGEAEGDTFLWERRAREEGDGAAKGESMAGTNKGGQMGGGISCLL